LQNETKRGNKMRKLIMSLIVATTVISSVALSHEKNEIFVRIGAAQVNPDASSDPVLGGRVDVKDATGLGFSGTWFVNPHFGIEVLAALPFEHDIVGTGALAGLDIGSTKHLPPTVSLQYYPFTESSVQPYFGLGLNYTTFFSTGSSNELDTALGGDTDLSLDDSTGVAFQIGADWKIQDNLYLNAAIWKIDIETTADISVDGAHAASVDVTIDPLVFMLGAGFSF
jgi:outer membrane protein